MSHQLPAGHDTRGPDALPVIYTNRRGETAERSIAIHLAPRGDCALRFGRTKWHPEPQYLLTALDIDKGELRDFALAGFKAFGAQAVEEAAGPAALAEAVNSLVSHAHGASSAAGWWVDPETGADLSTLPFFPYVVGTKLMLMVSELSEAMEGHRKGLMDDKLPHRPMIEVELADAVLRIADLAGKLGCDLGGALVEKMAFNAVRPDHQIGARMAAGGKAY